MTSADVDFKLVEDMDHGYPNWSVAAPPTADVIEEVNAKNAELIGKMFEMQIASSKDAEVTRDVPIRKYVGKPTDRWKVTTPAVPEIPGLLTPMQMLNCFTRFKRDKVSPQELIEEYNLPADTPTSIFENFCIPVIWVEKESDDIDAGWEIPAFASLEARPTYLGEYWDGAAMPEVIDEEKEQQFAQLQASRPASGVGENQ
eukprot:CAMPEP_0175133836 /NCGR_PEP_ID=MMETSP0087-20121206/7857_1 /TAXON_ID=136419 /ORGANISM="Unknown Unknown, Strain D1" /LENGTH=200 /DNA_ID=CAMNT_0016416357 /DNA_START=87 /DNA_END=689 /DNA_ORIENTATION=+